MTREAIITSMCYTWRHDYGIEKAEGVLSFGMTKEEQTFLWNQMAHIYDNVIAPNMEFRK